MKGIYQGHFLSLAALIPVIVLQQAYLCDEQKAAQAVIPHRMTLNWSRSF